MHGQGLGERTQRVLACVVDYLRCTLQEDPDSLEDLWPEMLALARAIVRLQVRPRLNTESSSDPLDSPQSPDPASQTDVD